MLEKIAKSFGYFIIVISLIAGIASIISKDYGLLVLQILALLVGVFLIYVLKNVKIFKKTTDDDYDME
ncbi:hypothetical protein [Tissierella praeacuta]|uniref:hypothetical protein n=1 Tax=Tissierella praeacuta TaxID=43131 RepID=UPI000ECBC436|nr:hypothetical protein [Tissierella praeacuta]HAE91399.1 hypothetical protein [Tissierella sp.]